MMKYKFELEDDEADVFESIIDGRIKELEEIYRSFDDSFPSKTYERQLKEDIKYHKRLRKKIMTNRKQLADY